MVRCIEHFRGNFKINTTELTNNRICLFCEHKIIIKRQRKYCNEDCRNYFTDCWAIVNHWDTIRKYIWLRDKKSCQECGKKVGLYFGQCEIHHIIPRSKGGTDDHSNLITLCKNCHRKHTNQLLKMLLGKGIENFIQKGIQKQISDYI